GGADGELSRSQMVSNTLELFILLFDAAIEIIAAGITAPLTPFSTGQGEGKGLEVDTSFLAVTVSSEWDRGLLLGEGVLVPNWGRAVPCPVGLQPKSSSIAPPDYTLCLVCPSLPTGGDAAGMPASAPPRMRTGSDTRHGAPAAPLALWVPRSGPHGRVMAN
ncbi:hypothetical protein CB1_000958027, partial [Camelus ferus]